MRAFFFFVVVGMKGKNIPKILWRSAVNVIPLWYDPECKTCRIPPGGRILCALSLLRRRLQRSGEFQWEIGRFANLRGYTVVGGYSRLLKHALQMLRDLGVEKLVSYCNRDLSPDPTDTFYAKNGFYCVRDSGPIYWYITQRPITINGTRYLGRIPRQAVQKHKLLQHYKQQGLAVREGDTERTLCERLGLLPIYNAGNFKFELRL